MAEYKDLNEANLLVTWLADFAGFTAAVVVGLTLALCIFIRGARFIYF